MKQKLFASTLGLAFLSMVLPLSAQDANERQIYLSEVEVQEIFNNPRRSYIYVGKEVSEIAQVIEEICKLVEDQNSPIWGLKNHIARGFSIGNYDAVAQALEEADQALKNNRDKLDAEAARKLTQSLDEIINNVIEDKLTLDAELLSFLKEQVDVSDMDATRAGLRLLVVNERMNIHGRVHFYKKAIFYDDAIFRDEVRFLDDVTFQDNVTFQQPISLQDGVVMGTLSVTDLVVTSCVDSLCVNTLSITDQIIGGTLSATDIVIDCNLVVGCNLSLSDTITPAIGGIVIGGSPFISAFGTGNAFVGRNAGNFTLTGTDNTAFGNNALLALTAGIGNVAVGSGALDANLNSSNNTAVGVNALGNLTGGGGSNVAIGANAGTTLTTGNNNVLISADAAANNEANTIRIGFGGHTRAFIAGVRGVTTGNNNAIAVLIDSAGQLGTVSSTRRMKHAIQDMGNDSSAIYQLRPVTFAYNGDESETRHYGLIAEEVNEVLPEIVVTDEDGQPFTVQYHVLPALLLNEVKKLAARVAVLEARNN